MHGGLAPGARVRVGFREGAVLRAGRWARQDCYLVQFPVRDQGDGTAPHWIPVHSCQPLDRSGEDE